MSARQDLAAALNRALPTKRYKVLDAPREIDPPEINRPVVMLIRTRMTPANTVGKYLSEFALWVIEPKVIDPEDDLDAALDEVILALDKFPAILWSEAERSTYRELYPAYRIALTTVSERT